MLCCCCCFFFCFFLFFFFFVFLFLFFFFVFLFFFFLFFFFFFFLFLFLFFVFFVCLFFLFVCFLFVYSTSGFGESLSVRSTTAFVHPINCTQFREQLLIVKPLAYITPDNRSIQEISFANFSMKIYVRRGVFNEYSQYTLVFFAEK